jgi:hypothetical protein
LNTALVDKLIKEGKQLQAISFASSFGIMDKIDPSHLLKTYLEDSEKAAKLLVEKARSKASGLVCCSLNQFPDGGFIYEGSFCVLMRFFHLMTERCASEADVSSEKCIEDHRRV